MRRSMRHLAAIVVATAVLGFAVPLVHATDDSFTVLVRFYPVSGREAELQARLTKLKDFGHVPNPGVTYTLHWSATLPVVFLMYETFPSRAAFDDMAARVFPAFQKENGPIPVGIAARPVEREVFRAVSDR